MLPFFGKVHVAYIPKGKVIGLSKIPRLIRAIGIGTLSATALAFAVGRNPPLARLVLAISFFTALALVLLERIGLFPGAQQWIDLAVTQQRLEDAVRRWRVLAVTCRVLETIRATYERDRQPETLCEASGYLASLTEGHYRRVWTPLGERVLRV